MEIYYLIIWLMLFLLFFVVEILTSAIFSFFAGALASLIGLLFWYYGFSFFIQIAAFFISSFIFFLLFHYGIKSLSFFKTHGYQKSNMYALVGKHALVVVTITHYEKGYVKIQEELWLASSSDNNVIMVGEEVEIMGVVGAHVVVKKRT